MATAAKSAFWPTKFLYVASLDLDIKNPRLGGIAASFSPKDIVQYLFQHDKAIEVADSIANRGYFPNEPLLAIRTGSRYTIVEGNRRLAALMALREPSLLTGAAQRALERLATKISKDDIKRVPVTIAPNRRATDKQVAGRHVGTPVLAWKSENRSRFILEKLDEGYTKEELLSELGFSTTDVQAARETQAIMAMARSVELPLDVKEKIDDLRMKSLSTLERLFESTVGRDIMHAIRDEEHGYRIMTTQEEFVPFFQKLLTLVANNKISTRTFNTGDDIKAYFKKWKDLPAKRPGSFVPSDLVKKGKKKAALPTAKPTPRQKPLFQTVLPTSLKILYGAPRLRIVRDELTSLNRDKKANAGAVLLRVFFELCVVDYLLRSGRMAKLETQLKAKNVRWKYDYPDMGHLLKEIERAAKANLKKGEAEKVSKAIFGNKETPHVLNDLHAFVHDSADLPIGSDILQFWLRTEPLFRLMLESDPSTHK